MLKAARLMSSMPRNTLRKELRERRSDRKLGRRNARLRMNDDELRRPDDGRRRNGLRLSRKRNVRRKRLGRSLNGSAKKENFEKETGSATGRETVETPIAIGIEKGIGIGIGTETAIGMTDIEDMKTIRDPADVLIERTERAEILAESQPRSLSYPKKILSGSNRRL